MNGATSLHREISGDREPLLVVLHEGASSSRDWDGFLPELTADRGVLAYDRRGFGLSPRDTDYGAALFAEDVDDLAQLLAASGHRATHLLGHSDGGTVALLAAATHPELVLSVTAVAAHVRPDASTVAAVRNLGSPSDWGDPAAQSYQRRHGDDWQEVVTAWLRLWSDPTRTTWDITQALGSVTCPVLVVHDRDDPLSAPLHAEEIQAAIPHARVEWYETGDHRPHRRDRPRFLAELAAHLSDAERPASS